MDDDLAEDEQALDVRFERLEQRLRRIEEALGLNGTASPASAGTPPPPRAADRMPGPAGPLPPNAPPPVAPPSAPRTWPDAEVLLKWAGVLLVFLAGVFAVSTAIDRGWIGPELQLAGSLAGGLGLIGYGLRLDRVRPTWGHALVHAGLGVLFTTAGAAHGWLDLAPLWTAGVGAVVVAIAGLGLARYMDREGLGFNAIAGFLLVPLLLHVWDTWTGGVLAVGLALGALAVTALALDRQWLGLRVIVAAVIGVLFLILAGWVASEGTSTDELVTALSAIGLAALWWGLPILSLWQSVGSLGLAAGVPAASGRFEAIEARLTLAVPAWVWAVTAMLWFDGDQRGAGLYALAMAMGFLGVALLTQPWCRRSHWLGQLVGISLLATIGLAMATSGDAVLLGLTVQTVGLLVLARALDDNFLLANGGVLGVIVAVSVAARMVEAVDIDAAFVSDLTNLAVVVALGVVVFVLRRLSEIRWLAGLTVAGVMLWLLATLVHLPQGHVIVSVTWAAIGIGVLLAGALLQRTDVGTAGLVVLAVTMLKLFTVDLSEVDTFWRAGLFLVVGAGLLRLGYSLPALTSEEAEKVSDT